MTLSFVGMYSPFSFTKLYVNTDSTSSMLRRPILLKNKGPLENPRKCPMENPRRCATNPKGPTHCNNSVWRESGGKEKWLCTPWCNIIRQTCCDDSPRTILTTCPNEKTREFWAGPLIPLLTRYFGSQPFTDPAFLLMHVPHPFDSNKANYDYEGCAMCPTPLKLGKPNYGSTRCGMCFIALKNVRINTKYRRI